MAAIMDNTGFNRMEGNGSKKSLFLGVSSYELIAIQRIITPEMSRRNVHGPPNTATPSAGRWPRFYTRFMFCQSNPVA